MALRDRQILTHLEQLSGDIAKYIFDEVRAYRARLAQGARRVLKGHIVKGSITDYLINKMMMTNPWLDAGDPVERFFVQRADTWKSLRLNWTPRQRRYYEREEYRQFILETRRGSPFMAAYIPDWP